MSQTDSQFLNVSRGPAELAYAVLGDEVGILGSGQLARMLAESAHRLGLRPLVFAADAGDPAARVCQDVVIGSWNDPAALQAFFSRAKLIAFENEFVPCETLDLAAKDSSQSIRFFPELATLAQLQDKVFQKEILAKLGIPSAKYEVMPTGQDARKWAQERIIASGGQCVFKWAQLGYDGKGTFIFPDTGPGDDSEVSAAQDFCEAAVKKGVSLFVEAKVQFKRELAVVACFSTRHEFAAYPLVISEQRRGVCKWVKGPATAIGVDSKLETLAHDYARRLAVALSLYGTFAVEMFETADGGLWVNELAPRVHNTGHYTLDASRTSQFENHWRAILGLPLGEVTSAPAFAMLNLLGPDDLIPADCLVPLPGLTSRIHLHWYGKTEIRPGRKLGHLSGAVDRITELPFLIHELEECERKWLQKLGKN